MPSSAKLSSRDEQIVEALCTRIRLLSLGQIAEHWWNATERATDNARRRLAALISAGYLTRRCVLATALPAMAEPVLCWSPADAEPDTGAVAWRLQSRWIGGPRSTWAFLATDQAQRLFGGAASGRLKRPLQASHDFGVAQMYLQLCKRAPQLATAWYGEDQLASYRRRQKLPDAVLASSPQAAPWLVLEFGGAYQKSRVQAFHDDCRRRGQRYEIW